MTLISQQPRLVTVFGGSGFIGRHIVRALAAAGYRVRVAVRRPDLAFHLQPLGGVGQIVPVQANLRFADSVRAAVAGADAVVNAVGVLRAAGAQTAAAVNADGARRIAEARAIYDKRPSQAEAEASAPKRQPAEPDAEYAALIERLREAVKANPEDPRGLELLAEHESRLGNTIAAKDAQARLVALRGDAASATDWSRLAALTVEAAGGLITSDAETAITRTLERDPHNPQARFMTGLLDIQSGRPDLAFPIWAQLLAEGPADAPWMMPIRASIGDLAWFAGRPDYTPPETGGNGGATAMPGPDAGAMAAAENMSPEERQQMIQGMVKGLEDRLSSQGGTPQEWARLIGALPVIGQADHAQDILTEARARFSSDAEALKVIETAAEQAGLK
jgi:cytochrome c-type biogenesis protein CcmH